MFPVAGGVGEAQTDTLQARKCYVEAIRRGKKRILEEASGEENSKKWGKDSMPRPELKEEAPVAGQSVEELLTVELIPGINMEVYVDDMLVESKEAHHHVEDLDETFAVLRKYRLKLNLGKCAFRVSGGRFLGFMVTQRGRIAALSRFMSKSAEKGLPFFKTLRKVKKFEWTQECQQAFEEFKTYLAKLPLLVKPVPGDTLYLYISATSQAISSVLVREEEGNQTPIYYVSKALNGAESRYPPIEKMALALVITARKLRPYSLSYLVRVRTNTPLKQVLGKPEASGRLVKWAIELSEYDVSYLSRTTIKAQAYRAGIVLITPQADDMEFAIKFKFKASNNEAEYEALVLGMRITQDAGASHFLAYSDSQLIVKQVNGEYEVKEESMMLYLQQIEELKIKFKSFQLQQIPREKKCQSRFSIQTRQCIGRLQNTTYHCSTSASTTNPAGYPAHFIK
ncbi:UNVERIFIED_CONTAM: hypothetical protein Slati_3639000 [Sesamum latifolium]|uniref:Reverse transcriptase/retrotransposon-derived protein RNase H-like domain-containing protein n=1 Tax=Sesamum latifolium TaxID=2727402 RepID=A0AAW2U1X5_9LAMI